MVGQWKEGGNVWAGWSRVELEGNGWKLMALVCTQILTLFPLHYFALYQQNGGSEEILWDKNENYCNLREPAGLAWDSVFSIALAAPAGGIRLALE